MIVNNCIDADRHDPKKDTTDLGQDSQANTVDGIIDTIDVPLQNPTGYDFGEDQQEKNRRRIGDDFGFHGVLLL